MLNRFKEEMINIQEEHDLTYEGMDRWDYMWDLIKGEIQNSEQRRNFIRSVNSQESEIPEVSEECPELIEDYDSE